jgi:hypothetical protein
VSAQARDAPPTAGIRNHHGPVRSQTRDCAPTNRWGSGAVIGSAVRARLSTRDPALRRVMLPTPSDSPSTTCSGTPTRAVPRLSRAAGAYRLMTRPRARRTMRRRVTRVPLPSRIDPCTIQRPSSVIACCHGRRRRWTHPRTVGRSRGDGCHRGRGDTRADRHVYAHRYRRPIRAPRRWGLHYLEFASTNPPP